MLVHCYFIREGGRITHQQKEISLQHREGLPDDLALPSTVVISYDAALMDETMRDRFDPRANWDQWVSGANPFAREIVLKLTPSFGLTYLDDALLKRVSKHVPEIKAHISFAGAFEEVLKNPINEHWADGMLGQTARFPHKKNRAKGPDACVWKK